MNNESYQNLVFGENTLKKIYPLSKYEAQINSFLDSANLLEGDIHCTNFYSMLIEAEKNLGLKNRNQTALQKTKHFNKIIESVIPSSNTLFLSDEKITSILKLHPPINLDQFLSSANSNIKLSNRSKLALTRFSENSAWQNLYHSILEKTTTADYQVSSPQCIGINAQEIAPLLKSSGQKIKPWGVSHSKETGVIILFEENNSKSATPELLTLAVFLHYIFEVYYFSSFLYSNSHTKTGHLVKSIILSKEAKVSFLTDGNAHDETLYWRKSIPHLCEATGLNQETIQKSLNKLVKTEAGYQSLNFIDALWDLNNIYPGKKNVYHLQQEVWLSLLEDLSEQEEKNFAEIFKNSLTFDNLSFLNRVLN